SGFTSAPVVRSVRYVRTPCQDALDGQCRAWHRFPRRGEGAINMRTGFIQAIALALVVIGYSGTAAADGKDPQTGKVGSMLMTLHRDYGGRGAQVGGVQITLPSRRMRMVNDRVFVDAVATGDASILAADLVALGMQSVAVHGRVVSGQLPVTAIPVVARLASLRFVRPSIAIHRAGSVTSQGDHATRADIARSTLGVSGAGVKVGVLSDSFNCKGGAPANVTAGDLPVVQVVREEPDCTLATDEGRAMLQI